MVSSLYTKKMYLVNTRNFFYFFSNFLKLLQIVTKMGTMTGPIRQICALCIHLYLSILGQFLVPVCHPSIFFCLLSTDGKQGIPGIFSSSSWGILRHCQDKWDAKFLQWVLGLPQGVLDLHKGAPVLACGTWKTKMHIERGFLKLVFPLPDLQICPLWELASCVKT